MNYAGLKKETGHWETPFLAFERGARFPDILRWDRDRLQIWKQWSADDDSPSEWKWVRVEAWEAKFDYHLVVALPEDHGLNL